jgi:septal ring factor EnvC (AmiA/AmiB activator)
MEAANQPPETGQESTGPTDERAWLEQVDRKLTTRTYIGAAAAVMALAAAIVALVLALDARDNSASKADVKRLEQQLTGVTADATSAEDIQDSIDSLSGRIDALQDSVDSAAAGNEELEQRLGVVEDDIEDLRQQLSDLESQASSGGTGSGSAG